MSVVVTIGESLALLSAPTVGPLQHADSMRLGIGGAESNVAIALSRLGTPVTWIGKVGTDPLGDLIVRELQAEGVTVVAARDPEVPTSLMIKQHRTPGSSQVWYYRRGNAGGRLRSDEFDADTIRGARLLHVTGISPALSDTMRKTVFDAVGVAREAGVLVSFDLNYRGRLWSTTAAAALYAEMIPRSDIVFAGDDEAAIAVGAAPTPLHLAHRLVDAGAGQAIIKLGRLGAVALVDGHEYARTAVPIEPVDTVGAGDAFVAGYLADLLAGADVETRLTTAVAAGAYACLAHGDWEGAPRRSELALLTGSDPVSR